uniref:uncharacterized protein LOC120325614 n=1 Tax=Styela clava TaxID=7725 RepID=UPI00193A6DAB|nr:uncharacterized protein LOC120325614 [Styela clava]
MAVQLATAMEKVTIDNSASDTSGYRRTSELVFRGGIKATNSVYGSSTAVVYNDHRPNTDLPKVRLPEFFTRRHNIHRRVDMMQMPDSNQVFVDVENVVVVNNLKP